MDLVSCLRQLTLHLEAVSASKQLSCFEQLLIKALLSPLNAGGGCRIFFLVISCVFAVDGDSNVMCCCVLSVSLMLWEYAANAAARFSEHSSHSQ